MAAKAAQAVQKTSKAPSSKPSPRARERGIVLLDLVIAMALLSFLILLVVPSLPHGTTASRLGAYAAEVAAVLKNDRTAAARSGREVATQVDLANKRIASGSSRRTVSLPADVTLDLVASDACRLPEGQFAVVFAPDGRSCGAVVSVATQALIWRIRINWLTGFVDVVPPQTNG
jgi:general secretion pathway protein H